MPLQAETIEWTRRSLDDETRGFLARLPERVATDDGVAVAHGSLDDPTVYVRDCVAGRAELVRLREREPDSAGLVLGHTHGPLACVGARTRAIRGRVRLPDDGTPWLLNAGSVGQSRERRPLARAMVLDTGTGEASFLALSYDVQATRSELLAAGLPARACHLEPDRTASFVRSLRSRWR